MHGCALLSPNSVAFRLFGEPARLTTPHSVSLRCGGIAAKRAEKGHNGRQTMCRKLGKQTNQHSRHSIGKWVLVVQAASSLLHTTWWWKQLHRNGTNAWHSQHLDCGIIAVHQRRAEDDACQLTVCSTPVIRGECKSLGFIRIGTVPIDTAAAINRVLTAVSMLFL